MVIPEEQILAAVTPTFIFPIREAHDSPLGQELIEVGKKVCNKLDLEGVGTGGISATFAKGFIITANNADLQNLANPEIIEILDYDPVRNNIIARGRKDPTIETPLHWFIYRGFHEIGAIIHIRNSTLAAKFESAGLKDMIVTPFKVKYLTPELSMEILKVIKGHKSIILKENGIMAIGDTLENAYQLIAGIYEKVEK